MKNKKVSLNVIITILVWLIVFSIKYQYDSQNIELNISIATIIGVLVNLYCVISILIIEKTIYSPYILFQVLSIIFLYGQLICRDLMGINITEMFDVRNLVSTNGIIEACFLIMYCQLSLHLGVLAYKILKKKKINNEIQNEQQEFQLRALKRVGYLLLIISVIPAFYELILRFNSAISSAYDGLQETNTYGIYSILNKLIPFFKISLLCLMLGYKENKNISKFILVFGIAFYAVQIFFGNRGIPLISIITLIWLYNIAVKRIDKKLFVILLICLIPITAIISVIRENRIQSGMYNWIFNIGSLMQEKIIEKNPIVETIYEMGTAIYPTAYVIDKVPEKMDYQYGKSYVLSVFSIITVNITNEKNNLVYEMNAVAQISELAGSSFGGSYIEEAYVNFGWLSPLFAFLVGVMFEILNRKINSSKALINLALIAYFLNPLLWTVRNVMITLPREFVWYILPTYILYKLYCNSILKKSSNKVFIKDI